ncbi:MAG: ACP S-malonyltransferase [Chloroflexi bacterium]|nr:ACP S-malonyltransferase [Chloroflexota bacterium]
MTILVDHNIEGQALRLWGELSEEGWLELLPLRLMGFRDVGLPEDSNDREIWRYAQAHRCLLFTNNRKMLDPDSLEQTIRDENTSTSLPVLTVGNADRLTERVYREECMLRLLEIAIYLDDYLGVG